ncbi:TetR family transcriptional regulator [Prauserella sp. PE36]|uniref:TetR/AcrR family transcriptional regulator n=1 Tax=Prauserella endophytica TaxID=1592324 RepID=A0ABY2RXL0_9PSEU|nr:MULTISPECIES: TetR/AcrR family transcriptional regulator [Prauserella]PXY33073.1 TetR family transcriptional regulator [Prauserella coralliicola]RBM16375.1 TetR family transcriptional regulator [Prauserella sp. PE36]TKG62640.1 TetR/AcrR family transcriptional regulator [Prauserella endophytica]
MAGTGEARLSALVRVWGDQQRRTRGPAPAYSRDQIADAAIEIADEEGLAAVTMRKVAARLGTGAMSLYRYVANKEALVELMADRIFGREEWPEPSGDWKRDLGDIARGQRRALLAHPWLPRVWSGRPAMGPNMLRGFERSMSILDGLGLGIDDMFETIALVNTWVDGYVQSELATREFFGDADDEEVHRAMAPYVESVIESGEYPYFARLIAEAKAPHQDAESRFERALDRILAGIEATLPE